MLQMREKSILYKFCGQATPLIQGIFKDKSRCHIHQVYHLVSDHLIRKPLCDLHFLEVLMKFQVIPFWFRVPPQPQDFAY